MLHLNGARKIVLVHQANVTRLQKWGIRLTREGQCSPTRLQNSRK